MSATTHDLQEHTNIAAFPRTPEAHQKAKSVPYCEYCGSEEISFDATATWDKEQQEFVLIGTMDDAVCEACGEESRPSWVEVQETETSKGGA